MMPENESNRSFYCYRYFVVHNGQFDLFDADGGKRDVVKELLEKCQTKSVEAEIPHGFYHLIHCKTLKSSIHILKFSRDSEITKYELVKESSDIVGHKEPSNPYIYVIVDTQYHIILIEYRTAVFPKIIAARNALQNFIERSTHDLNYRVSIEEISDAISFWDVVQNAEQIFKFELNLKSPNYFGGKFTTNDLLESLKAELNMDETEVHFKNSKGNLRIEKSKMEDPITYATAGGGHFKLRYRPKRLIKPKTFSSKDCVKSVELPVLETNDGHFELIDEDTIVNELFRVNEESMRPIGDKNETSQNTPNSNNNFNNGNSSF